MGWIYLGLVVAGFVAMNFVMKLGSLRGHSVPALTASSSRRRPCCAEPSSSLSGKPLYPLDACRAPGRRRRDRGRGRLFLFSAPSERGPMP
ncbi:MAG: hypothetical protein MZV64_12705 [Ignavibacteriales bacterium]|nr:hypothetical protein [Ignavibacteriales bacterium]